MSPSQPLRAALKERFYPFAKDRGFAIGKATPMFTPFQRVVGERIQFFEIQWDKYHRPRFVINFGEHACSESGGSATFPAAGRLQRWRGGSMRAWFQISKPWGETVRTMRWSYQPDEVAAQLVDCFAELEAWWSSKQEGPHVYIWRRRVG